MKKYLSSILLCGSIAIVGYSSSAVARSSVEIQRIAKQTTIQITRCAFGSGVIIQKNGNTYTVLTVAHAVKNSNCEVTTPDNSKYQIAQVKTFPNSIDLATFTFTSNKNYSVAKLIDNSDRIEATETIYVSGFPLSTAIKNSTFTIIKGDVVANPIDTQQGKGYSLIYSNNTLPGYSGGPVWNDKGELIAIHGQGDVDTKLQDTANDGVRVKTGYNLGITVNTFNKFAASAGLNSSTIIASNPVSNPVRSATNSTSKPFENPVASIDTSKLKPVKPKPLDDLIASAIQKQRERDYQGAIADLDRAISLAPQNSRFYVIRGQAKERLINSKDSFAAARADYNQAIAIDPRNAEAYYHRANINFGDSKGKIADLNRAIAIAPNYAIAYDARASAKYESKDYQGTISDINRYIALVPDAGNWTYNFRARTKLAMGQKNGAIADFNLAIAIDPKNLHNYYQRGEVRLSLGDNQGAIADFTNALKLDSRYIQAYQSRGMARSTGGDRQGAISDLRIVAAEYKKQVEEYQNNDNPNLKKTARWYQDRYQKVLKEIARLGGN
ncbi:tetratricopeptide repeat protein [Chamaesiphon sp. VAR_48_metabat_403]|uniref:tetratricopeptide repeat protein n=1 Tax=Chamaesiphon sp. VAR_48_metabat_403 TaxID=2964700 RepID=UPI00286DCB6A|nr:tetratricopeptide repeat protein [Chamaesiphon sp. VAR_48_metabat_403]